MVGGDQSERDPGEWEMSQVPDAIRVPGGRVREKSVGGLGERADGVSVIAPLAEERVGVLEGGSARAGGTRRGRGKERQQCLCYRPP